MTKTQTLKSLGVALLASAFIFSGNDAFAQKKKKKKDEVVAAVQAPTIPDAVKQSSVEGITEYKLDNGMRVLLFPDQSKSTMTVNITYLVGSRHEGYGETGMAHLLEHMVFKGSTKHTNIPAELTAHGCRPNGTTWLDRTNYYETFAASDENLKWALDLESDRMVNSFIKKTDLETEFSVVRNEFEMGENDPGSVLNERIISTGYIWHNYGNSTIGSREDIERVPIENLKGFYQKYYQPDNAVLMVAGKIDEPKTLKLINEYFGSIPRPSRILQQPYTVEPTQDGERHVELRRNGDTQAIGAMYHICPSSHPDYPAIDILLDILTDQPSGRLYKSLVDTKKVSYQFGYSFALKDPGFAYFGAEVLKDKDVNDAFTTMKKTLDDVKTMTFTKEEVDRAKATAAKNLDLLLGNSERLGLTMSEFIAQGDWRLIYLYRDAIEKVSIADVDRVAKFYFKPSNRTTGVFMPDKEPERVNVPASKPAEELVAGYKGRQKVAEGEAFDPSPANIEARTRRGQEPNGIEFAFLPKQTRGNLVSANITLRIGDEKSLSNQSMNDNLTASMLDKGTKTLTRQVLKDSLSKLKAQANIFGGGNSVQASISTTKENLPKVMLIVAEMLKNPTFDASEFDKLVQEELAGIESQKSDPMALAGVAFQRTLNPYQKTDVRYTPTFEEQIEMLKSAKLDDLKKFHKQFYGASSATVSVVGDFDEASIRKVVTEQFGNWNNPTKFARIPSVYQEIPASSNAVKTPDKPNAMFLAGQNLQIQDTDPDYAALVMGNYILGGGFLNSRLAVRIRQKEGISYGVGSNVNAQSLDKVGSFTTYAIYAPENAEKLEKAFLEEINKVRTEGFTEDELKAAKTGWLQSRSVSRAQDRELSGRLNNYLYIDRTLQFDADFEKKVDALTVADINAAVKKYIDPTKMTLIKAGDFDKKAGAAPANEAGKTGGSKN
jgi:zinc protease